MVNTETSAANSFFAGADMNKQSRRLKARPLALTDLLLDDRSDARSESTSAGTQSSSTEDSARSSPLHYLPPPPGLPHPESELAATPVEVPPSLGSALHASGQCKPCGWFWKPEGCKNGSQCFHCHLCPKDSMKLQRRIKREAARLRPSLQLCDKGEVNPCQIASQAVPPPPPLSSPMLSVNLGNVDLPLPPSHSPLLAQEQQALPSIGALLHDAGKCRPCAFFHREQGCLNGKECNHCHACPSQELKMRKMEKIAARKTKQGVEAATPKMLNLSSLL